MLENPRINVCADFLFSRCWKARFENPAETFELLKINELFAIMKIFLQGLSAMPFVAVAFKAGGRLPFGGLTA